MSACCVRRGRPRRVQRAGHARPGRARTRLELTEVTPVPQRRRSGCPTALYWDVLGLYHGHPRPGCAAPAGEDRRRPVWPSTPGRVDYGLLDADGALLRQPAPLPRPAHRRRRSTTVHAQVDPARLYAVNGLQFLPFNTLYQLAAEPELGGRRAAAADPGPARLLAHRPAGRRGDQRLHHRPARRPHRRLGAASWSRRSACRAGLLPDVVAAGRGARRRSPPTSGARSAPTTAPLRHHRRLARHRLGGRRRARADGPNFGYISCGTWGWSASSSTRRCSPRTAGRPTSPTSAASTAPSATCAT